MKHLSSSAIVLLALLGQAVSAAENTPTVEFGGRVHADATYYDNDKFPYQDGSELRRGRIYFRGLLAPDWEYRVQTEFSGDDPELKDGYVRYTGPNNASITVGSFKQFSSLEFLTSSNNITFSERAMVNALVTDRRMGVGYQRWDERYTLGASVYTHEANNNVRGEGVGGRFVYRPALQGDAMLHLGVNLARETDDDDRLRLRARPDSHQSSHRIIDTGTIANVDEMERVGFEAAWVQDRFSAQGEFVTQEIGRSLGSDLSFSGYYAYASYFLTDDTRPYSNSSGAFGTVDPSSERGAWEVAARLSSLDLSDAGVLGGQAETLTFAVNYYMNRNVRLSANYIMADSDAVAGDDDPNILQLRIRVTF